MQQGVGVVGQGGPHTPSYHDQFLTVLLATFKMRLKQSKQGAATYRRCGRKGRASGWSLTAKYLDLCLTVLLAIFTKGLIFARQLKQGAATLWGIGSGRGLQRGNYILLNIFDQILMVLLATFTTGLIFGKQSKQGAATLFLTETTHPHCKDCMQNH